MFMISVPVVVGSFCLVELSVRFPRFGVVPILLGTLPNLHETRPCLER